MTTLTMLTNPRLFTTVETQSISYFPPLNATQPDSWKYSVRVDDAHTDADHWSIAEYYTEVDANAEPDTVREDTLGNGMTGWKKSDLVVEYYDAAIAPDLGTILTSQYCSTTWSSAKDVVYTYCMVATKNGIDTYYPATNADGSLAYIRTKYREYNNLLGPLTPENITDETGTVVSAPISATPTAHIVSKENPRALPQQAQLLLVSQQVLPGADPAEWYNPDRSTNPENVTSQIQFTINEYGMGAIYFTDGTPVTPGILQNFEIVIGEILATVSDAHDTLLTWCITVANQPNAPYEAPPWEMLYHWPEDEDGTVTYLRIAATMTQPAFTTHPQAADIPSGHTAQFTAAATQPAPWTDGILTWHKGDPEQTNPPLAQGAQLSWTDTLNGTTRSSTLTITDATTASAGNYYCQIEYPTLTIHSNAAPLTVWSAGANPWYSRPGCVPYGARRQLSSDPIADFRRALVFDLDNNAVYPAWNYPLACMVDHASPCAGPYLMPSGIYAGGLDGYLYDCFRDTHHGQGTAASSCRYPIAALSTTTLLLVTVTAADFLMPGFLTGLPVLIRHTDGTEETGTIAANTETTITLTVALATAPAAGAELFIAPIQCGLIFAEQRTQHPTSAAALRPNIANTQPAAQRIDIDIYGGDDLAEIADWTAPDATTHVTIGNRATQPVIPLPPNSARARCIGIRFIPNGGGRIQIESLTADTIVHNAEPGKP